MPHWCSTGVVFYGDKDKLDRLMEEFNSYGDEICIDDFLRHHDFDEDQRYILDRTVIEHTRGFARRLEYGTKTDENFREHTDYTHIRLDSDDAWSPCIKAYETIARMYGVKCVIQAEEFGSEVYVNTDKEGRFFTDRYTIDNCEYSFEGDEELGEILGFNEGHWYFETKEEVIELFKDYSKKNIKTITDIRKILEPYDCHLHIYMYSY